MADPRLPLGRRTVSPGTRLNGLYEVDVLVASGGMGEIYRAHAIQTGDAVAIKMMLPEFAADEQALALFRKEASALHKLHHDAIVRYYVFSVEPALRRPYLAMEFVEGQTLSQRLAQGPLTYEATVTLMKRVAGGLQAAHERGIIHRDVSPDNIIIPSGGDVGRAKIIDFGIARSTQLGNAQTIIGVNFAGKQNYVSPEQLGLYGGEITPRSDIYSFGLVLAQALVGRPLNMGGNQVEVIEKRRKVPDLGNIEMRFRPLIDRMLQPSPADRPDSMAAVASWPLGAPQVLRRRNLDDLAGRRAEQPEPAPPRGRPRTWLAAAAFGGLAVLAGAGAGVYWLAIPPPMPSDAAGPVLQAAAPARPAPAPSPSPAAAPATPPPGTPSLAAPPAALPAPAQSATAAAPALIPAPAAEPQATPPPGWGSAGQPYRPPPPPSGAANATLTPAPAPPPTGMPAARSEPPPAAAALPPSAPLPPPDAPAATSGLAPSEPARVEQINRYIAAFEGGDCFFAAPVLVTASSARIEGYGASVRPFEQLDDAFRRQHGFEPDIGLRQVTAAQCPAVSFLRRARAARRAPPQLSISETNLKPGQSLIGTVRDHAASHVELLLVSDAGVVHNLSNLLKPAADGRAFNLKMQRTAGTGAQPQLLLAVTSEQPLQALRLAQPGRAEQVFARAAAEAAGSRQPVGVEMKYFKLER